MPLDSLLEQIRNIVVTMDRYHRLISGSESLTRYVLVDPLLRALGWNTEDPSLVIPEYSFPSGGKADYALMHDDFPLIVVEAKKLDLPLKAGTDQAITYCVASGIKYFAVTDGNVWNIYETHRPVATEKKLITSFKLSDSIVDACLEALVLWKHSEYSDTVKPKSGHPPIDLPNFPPALKPEHAPLVSPIENWISLNEFSSQDEKRKPTHIRFPDKTTVAIKYWSDLILKPAQWLVNMNHLTSSNCPIRMNGTSAKRYLVSEKAMHPSNKKFINAKPVGSLFVETHLNSAGCVDNACVLIRHAGKSTSEFRVTY